MSRRRTLAALGWIGGWVAGWVMGWRLPALEAPASLDRPTPGDGDDVAGVVPQAPAVVIPARDEAANIERLLATLRHQRLAPAEIVVVDDGSTDATAAVAGRLGATVVAAPPRPDGWTGKTWACATGVAATSAPVLVLLDADVELGPGALSALSHAHAELGGLVSVLPSHRPVRPYEQLSAPFNVVSVMGTGAARPGRDGRCAAAFGPCVVTSRTDLDAVGGFAAVASEVAEDVALGRAYARHGRTVHARSGADLVTFRMYPDGPAQLVEGWTKNLASGAAAVGPADALAVAGWVTASLAPVAQLVRRRGRGRRAWMAAVASAVQLGVLAGRVGRFRWFLAPLQPVAMVAFCAVFARSAWHRWVRHRTVWRGRVVPLGPPAGPIRPGSEVRSAGASARGGRG